MKNTLYMKKNSGIKRLIALVYICSIGIYSFAQMSPAQINPASQEDKTAFKGNYDIKMIILSTVAISAGIFPLKLSGVMLCVRSASMNGKVSARSVTA